MPVSLNNTELEEKIFREKPTTSEFQQHLAEKLSWRIRTEFRKNTNQDGVEQALGE